MKRLVGFAKKAGVSFCVSAGVLSIANVETIWREDAHRNDYAQVRLDARLKLNERLRLVQTTARPVNESSADLRDSLGNVELGLDNPFTALKDLTPLNDLLKKGVSSFTRQAYRSPNYKEESGYDLVEYRITHPDQTKSTILAYLERTLEGPDVVPVVLLVSNGPESAEQALYRDGSLIENRTVAPAVALTMVSQRLNAGVPFLSVAR